jgi:hypothetical protein
MMGSAVAKSASAAAPQPAKNTDIKKASKTPAHKAATEKSFPCVISSCPKYRRMNSASETKNVLKER